MSCFFSRVNQLGTMALARAALQMCFLAADCMLCHADSHRHVRSAAVYCMCTRLTVLVLCPCFLVACVVVVGWLVCRQFHASYASAVCYYC
jgi:hypothetical protein